METKSTNKQSEKFSRIDKFNLGLGLFNLLALAATIIVSVWGVNKSESIAEKAGAFDRAKLQLTFGGYHIKPDSLYDIYLGVYDTSKKITYELPFGVHNHGNKSLEDVLMLIRYPNESNIHINDPVNDFYPKINMDINRETFLDGLSKEVYYKFRSINPNLETEHGDMFTFSKDSNRALRSYVCKIKVISSAKDQTKNENNFNLKFYDQNSLEEMDDLNLIAYILSQRLGEENQNNPFFIIVPGVATMTTNSFERFNWYKCIRDDLYLCQFNSQKNIITTFERNDEIMDQFLFQNDTLTKLKERRKL